MPWKSGQWRSPKNIFFGIEHMCGRLIDSPMLGKSRDEIVAGIKSIAVRPHVIFYHLLIGH
jgi:plasmid stabilization system protein ParE